MKVLLIGEVYSENLGDGVICETVASLIRKEYSNCTLVMGDISGKKGYEDNPNTKKSHAKLFNFNRHFHSAIEYPLYLLLNSSKGKKTFIQDICDDDYDIAVFAGGQLLFNHFIIPISRYVRALSEKGVPVVFHSCGLGKIKGRQLKKLLKKTLLKENVISVSLRDNLETFQKEIMSDDEIEVQQTYDTALWCSEEYGIRKEPSERIGLGVMHLAGRKKQMIKFWLNVVAELDKQDLKWQLFCNGDPADEELAKEIASSYNRSHPQGKSDLAAPRPMTGEDLVRQIAGYHSILSFRLHSHIVACSLGIPSLAVGWDKKVNYFFQAIGQPERVFTHEDPVSEIIKKLEQLNGEKYDLKKIQLQKQAVLDQLYDSIENALTHQVGDFFPEKEQKKSIY
ncbi:polysaccharide pyruvyl transferase family protein [Carnobacterium sp. CS13]|uniref:polysaccharide pyruvyl transferase family protein n=1 Tax=Carnobacterium sp. CS13 TaxID=2800128 RepID=UPI00191376F5|nr:polysaccharide pyruvyl transferase family protein [Carnobacterium sp. CS13]QQP71129.1 polysaccharide pyruvyl transferase family protein [Carnobacterium sp. CS13]